MPHRSSTRTAQRLALIGPWPEGPWWLFGAAALLAAPAVLAQGADPRLGIVAVLACAASPGAAIEAMLGLVRLATLVAPPGR